MFIFPGSREIGDRRWIARFAGTGKSRSVIGRAVDGSIRRGQRDRRNGTRSRRKHIGEKIMVRRAFGVRTIGGALRENFAADHLDRVNVLSVEALLQEQRR